MTKHAKFLVLFWGKYCKIAKKDEGCAKVLMIMLRLGRTSLHCEIMVIVLIIFAEVCAPFFQICAELWVPNFWTKIPRPCPKLGLANPLGSRVRNCCHGMALAWFLNPTLFHILKPFEFWIASENGVFYQFNLFFCRKLLLIVNFLFIRYFIASCFILVRRKSNTETACISRDFKRSYLASQVSAGSGITLESVKDLQAVSKKNFILIAPKSQKTIKVILFNL